MRVQITDDRLAPMGPNVWGVLEATVTTDRGWMDVPYRMSIDFLLWRGNTDSLRARYQCVGLGISVDAFDRPPLSMSTEESARFPFLLSVEGLGALPLLEWEHAPHLLSTSGDRFEPLAERTEAAAYALGLA